MYLEPHHSDIFSFLEAKKNHGAEEERARDLFYALWVPDLFMERIEANGDWYLMDPDACPGLPDVYGEEYNNLYLKYVAENRYVKKIKARDLWQAVISSQVETGIPYIGYKDHVNKKNNQKNIGTIKSSNLCVSGDTMILTDDGYFPIKSLENKNVKVWNSKQWSNTFVKKTGINQKLLKIKFSNGLELKCTEYHKFYIETSLKPADKSIIKIYDAKELKKGMRIIRYQTAQVNDNDNDLIYAYTHGLYCADGTMLKKNNENKRCNYKCQKGKDFCGRHLMNIKTFNDTSNICCSLTYNDKPLLSLYNKKIKLLDYINKISVGEYCEKQDKITVSLPYDIAEKYYVPINNSLNSKIRWLEGYVDGDGCIIKNNGIKNIQFSSNNLKFLENILYLLQTLSISTQIKPLKEESDTLLPNGKGGKKIYHTKKTYRMSIDSIGLNKLKTLGFNPKRLDISNSRLPHHITNMYIKIDDIIDEDIYEDTYCFNEHLEHKGIFNGILTGQCIEINQVSNKEETAVCNLASICLPKILEFPQINNESKWYSLLSKDELGLYDYYFKGDLKIYTKDDCVYCKLLKALLTKTGLKYEEINGEQSEKYRILCDVEPFETVPQLFSISPDEKVSHLGGYDDSWNFLKPRINHEKLSDIAYDLVINLNKVIDKNFYPTEKTRISNLRHRPMGIGVQGLADLFIMLKISFDSEEASKINKEIFETIYYGSMSSSIDLAEKDGSYSSFKGSPLSEGLFQFNLWDLKDEDLSGRWNWFTLRKKLLNHGARNSLLTALMPTASTSQIMGSYVEAFEALTSNLYTRRTLAGEFTVVNPYLIQDLIDLDIWTEDTKDRLIYDKGSVQKIKGLPKFLKDIYKTVWEISQKTIITMSAERGVFICQSQSINLFFDKPDFKTLTQSHFHGWKSGLKTGSYYIRSKPALSAQRFGFDSEKEQRIKEEDEGCLNCSA